MDKAGNNMRLHSQPSSGPGGEWIGKTKLDFVCWLRLNQQSLLCTVGAQSLDPTDIDISVLGMA